MKFAFIAKHRPVWPVSWMCAALGVSRSGFHRARTFWLRSDDGRYRSGVRSARPGLGLWPSRLEQRCTRHRGYAPGCALSRQGTRALLAARPVLRRPTPRLAFRAGRRDVVPYRYGATRRFLPGADPTTRGCDAPRRSSPAVARGQMRPRRRRGCTSPRCLDLGRVRPIQPRALADMSFGVDDHLVRWHEPHLRQARLPTCCHRLRCLPRLPSPGGPRRFPSARSACDRRARIRSGRLLSGSIARRTTERRDPGRHRPRRARARPDRSGRRALRYRVGRDRSDGSGAARPEER